VVLLLTFAMIVSFLFLDGESERREAHHAPLDRRPHKREFRRRVDFGKNRLQRVDFFEEGAIGARPDAWVGETGACPVEGGTMEGLLRGRPFEVGAMEGEHHARPFEVSTMEGQLRARPARVGTRPVVPGARPRETGALEGDPCA
jgi:hypothetical protein